MHAADLSAVVLNELVERTGVDPDDRRRRRLGLRLAGRRPVEQHRPLLGARRGLARTHPRHHGQPGVRVEPAGARLRRAGRDVRPAGRRGGRRCRGDEPGAARLRARHRDARTGRKSLPAMTISRSTRASRAEMIAEKWGLLAHPARRVLRAVPRAGRGRAGRRRVRPTRSCRCSPTATSVDRRRGRPARHHGREARRAQAGVHGRRRHPRRQLVADLRRRGGAAGDDGRERASSSA